MAENFDPYVAWLGIKEPHRPLTNYQLLELRPFEADFDLIEKNARRQLEKLAAAIKGEHAHLAKRVAFELESAKVCLLDAKKKATYDAMLRSREGVSSGKRPAGATKTPVAQVVSTQTTNSKSASSAADAAVANNTFHDLLLEELGDGNPAMPGAMDLTKLALADSGEEYQDTPRLAIHRRKPVGISRQTQAAIVGVAIAVLLVMVVGGIMISSILQSGPVVDKRTPPKISVARADKPLIKMAPLTPASYDKAKVESDEKRGAENAAPKPIPLATDIEAKKAAAEKAKAAEAMATNNFAPLTGDFAPQTDRPMPVPSNPLPLSSATLPVLSQESIDNFVALGDLPALQNDSCEISVLNCLGDPNGDIWFQAEPIAKAPFDKSWQINMLRKDPKEIDASSSQAKDAAPIAQLARREGQLMFKWLPEARNAPFRRLQNCILSVHAGVQTQEVRLRRAKDVGPLTLDLGQEVLRISLDSDSLPDDKLLTLEILEIVKFPAKTALKPGSSLTGTRQPIRIVLKEDVPGVEIQMQLIAKDDKASVQIRPVTVEAGKQTTPFTGERFQTMMRAIPEDIAQTKAVLPALDARLRELQGLSRQIMMMRTDIEAERVTRLQAVQDEIRNVTKRMNTLQKKLPVLEKRLEIIQPLIRLGNEVHKTAVMRFRVFFVVDGKQVELLKAY